jgi:hypothetical protein
MIDRLDEERLEILRSWGAGLSSDHREELRAAGRAITVLIEEIDRLHVDLWHARADERRIPEAPVTAPASTTQGSALLERLTRTPRAI